MGQSPAPSLRSGRLFLHHRKVSIQPVISISGLEQSWWWYKWLMSGRNQHILTTTGHNQNQNHSHNYSNQLTKNGKKQQTTAKQKQQRLPSREFVHLSCQAWAWCPRSQSSPGEGVPTSAPEKRETKHVETHPLNWKRWPPIFILWLILPNWSIISLKKLITSKCQKPIVLSNPLKKKTLGTKVVGGPKLNDLWPMFLSATTQIFEALGILLHRQKETT